MATGTSTYKGLAVPLWGESEITQVTAADTILTLTGASGATGDFFSCFTSAGSEVFQIRSDGRTRLTRTAASSNTLDVYFTKTEVQSGQAYGQTIYFDQVSFAPGAGRDAALNIFFAYDAGGAAAVSYINFAGPGSSGDMPTLFTILDTNLDSGLFVTTNQAATRGLVIYVDNVEYRILLGVAS